MCVVTWVGFKGGGSTGEMDRLEGLFNEHKTDHNECKGQELHTRAQEGRGLNIYIEISCIY